MYQYHNLLAQIIETGTFKKPARAGMPATRAIFGHQMRFDLSEGFPIVTTKPVAFKGVVAENLWFLKGDTNIKFLDDLGVRYMWHQDAYNYYCKFVKSTPGFPDDLGVKISNNKSISEANYRLFTFDEFVDIIKNKSTDRISMDHSYGEYTLGDCGFQYGKVWRNWKGDKGNFIEGLGMITEQIDQISNLINGLRTNSEGRRHIITSIDPAHADELALYWCHAMAQFNCRPISREKRLEIFASKYDGDERIDELLPDFALDGIPEYYLDCALVQRSADTILGVPFNTAGYALLTHIFARMCNMIPGELVHTLHDAHIYETHIDAAKEQLQRIPFALPKLVFDDIEFSEDIDTLLKSIEYCGIDRAIRLEGYSYHPKLTNPTILSTGLK